MAEREGTAVFSGAEVRARLAADGLDFGPAAEAKLAGFLSLLAKWNAVYNLTGIRDTRLVLDRNLAECLQLAPLLQGSRIADVGTGAGLPGVPLAIVEPGRRFTLIESRAKRVHFLRHVAGELALDNVEIAHCRAEDLPKGPPFDTVLARAVAPPPELLQIMRPLTAPGSILALLTSPEKGAAFRGLAADFTLRQMTPVGVASSQAVIVLLERTAE
jgi:16S rRNA (guanine527-N7)-methyltransferase